MTTVVTWAEFDLIAPVKVRLQLRLRRFGRILANVNFSACACAAFIGPTNELS